MEVITGGHLRSTLYLCLCLALFVAKLFLRVFLLNHLFTIKRKGVVCIFVSKNIVKKIFNFNAVAILLMVLQRSLVIAVSFNYWKALIVRNLYQVRNRMQSPIDQENFFSTCLHMCLINVIKPFYGLNSSEPN